MSLLQKFEASKLNNINIQQKIDDIASDLNRRIQTLETKANVLNQNEASDLRNDIIQLQEQYKSLISELETIHNTISSSISDLNLKLNNIEHKIDDKESNTIKIKPILNK